MSFKKWANNVNPVKWTQDALRNSKYEGKEKKAQAADAQKAQVAGQSIDQTSGVPGMGQFLSQMGGGAASGAAFGNQLANTLYGQNMAQTGGQIQDILARRKANLEGNDIVSNRIRGGAANQVMQSRAAAIAAGQRNSGTQAKRESQIKRQAGRDIASAMFDQRDRDLANYQSATGKVAEGQGGLTFQAGALGSGAQYIAPGTQKSPWDSVICTELYRQGYMPDYVYQADQALGDKLAYEDPFLMSGYHFLARPIVKLMKKSKLFTKLVSFVAMPWAYHIAGDTNLVGATIFFIGKPICRITGKLTTKRELCLTLKK
jgi:hypothetical protein